MRTTWIVEKVTATPNRTVAELQRVEWYKKNPAWDDQASDDVAVEEFIDAEPGEHGAEHIETDGSLSLEITDGWRLAPGDAVYMTLDAVAQVPA